MKQKQINNFGILAGIMWNSNKWEAKSTDDDIRHCIFDWVKKNMTDGDESFNFGHKKYPAEPDGTFIAYTSMFKRLPSKKKSENTKVVFFKSNDWHNKENYIVGMFAFPNIDERFEREGTDDIFKIYTGGNVKSEVSNIVRFDHYLPISNETLNKDRFLPDDKKLGQQGFNYLHSDNVFRILDKLQKRNPKQEDLLSVTTRLKEAYTSSR